MQTYTEIPDTKSLEASRLDILNNDKTALSNSSGTAFPTVNLQVGMSCYRTDQSKTYRLMSTGPDVWRLTEDNSAGIDTQLTAKQNAATAATLTGIQTLTNKTIDGASNTLTNIPGANITGTVPLATASTTKAITDNTVAIATTAFAHALVNGAEASVASAATTNIGAVTSPNVLITGTTGITSFGTSAAGVVRRCRTAGAVTLTHNATSLILPGGANIVTAVNDCFEAMSLGSGNWIVTGYKCAIGFDERHLTISTSTPSGGNAGDIWFERQA